MRDWRAKALFGADLALFPAEQLVDGEFIRVICRRTVKTIELASDVPRILCGDGLERLREPLSGPDCPMRRSVSVQGIRAGFMPS